MSGRFSFDTVRITSDSGVGGSGPGIQTELQRYPRMMVVGHL